MFNTIPLFYVLREREVPEKDIPRYIAATGTDETLLFDLRPAACLQQAGVRSRGPEAFRP